MNPNGRVMMVEPMREIADLDQQTHQTRARGMVAKVLAILFTPQAAKMGNVPLFP